MDDVDEIMIVRYVKRTRDWTITHFWDAKYVRARLIVTTGAEGTRGKVIHDKTYPARPDAFRAGVAMIEKLRGWIPRGTARPRPAPLASRSKSTRALPKPKWLAKLPQLGKTEKAIARANLSHRRSDILALAKPSIRLHSTRVKKWKGVISRMGGAPDMPKGMKWPSLGKIPYAFWLQLRCEDLARYDLERVLPKMGLLSFFLQAWYAHDSYGDEGAVFYFPSTKALVSLEPPDAPEMQGGPQATAAIRASLALSLPPPQSDPARALALNDDELRGYWDGVWLGHTDGGHHVLGYPDMNYNERLKKGVAMLLQICADDAAKFELGDVQPVRCYIDCKALAAKNFSRVVFTAEE
jgi:uncharacterized protein YwqG